MKYIKDKRTYLVLVMLLLGITACVATKPKDEVPKDPDVGDVGEVEDLPDEVPEAPDDGEEVPEAPDVDVPNPGNPDKPKDTVSKDTVSKPGDRPVSKPVDKPVSKPAEKPPVVKPDPKPPVKQPVSPPKQEPKPPAEPGHTHKYVAKYVDTPARKEEGYWEYTDAVYRRDYYFRFSDGHTVTEEFVKKNPGYLTEYSARNNVSWTSYYVDVEVKPASQKWIVTKPAEPAGKELIGHQCSCGSWK